MTSIQLLRKLGIFIIEDFLKASECELLCNEMRSARTRNARVLRESLLLEQHDQRIRQTQYCEMSVAAKHMIKQRLTSLKPHLEHFFNVSLDDEFENAKFLKYNKGDFFAPHTDAQYRRKINITINLNDIRKSHPEQGFEGGELQLFGLIKTPGFANKGIGAPAATGCLIAYPVDIVHEVTPVTAGTRYSIVSRFSSEH